MSKCPRFLQLRISTYICVIVCSIIVIQFFATPGSFNYLHIPVEVIETHLYKKTTPKLQVHTNKPDCKYSEILNSKVTVNPWDIHNNKNFDVKGVDNGSFVPPHCNPLFSVAILVTYRNRQHQLDIFLPYMHDFLRKQNIHYKIYLVEQEDEKLFNKGVLYNTGVKHAIRDQFPCLILHDVDMLPLDASNLYACTNDPRHMSGSVDKLRYVLTYDYLVGGALAIRTDHYELLNGYSNRFEGWGGEDDDFAMRLKSHLLPIVRFPREMSRYTMLPHVPEPKNSRRSTIMSENVRRGAAEGLSTLPYQTTSVTNHKLFTRIGVKL